MKERKKLSKKLGLLSKLRGLILTTFGHILENYLTDLDWKWYDSFLVPTDFYSGEFFEILSEGGCLRKALKVFINYYHSQNL